MHSDRWLSTKEKKNKNFRSNKMVLLVFGLHDTMNTYLMRNT